MKHTHRDYVIHELNGAFDIYDDQGVYLHQEDTLNHAKDWIEAEQAGEHD